MKFIKMSAAGNDFILFDNRNGALSGGEINFFRQICERRQAIGADGIILLEKSSVADFRYRHFNSDGSLAEMCGNGARAVCYYAVSRKLVQPHHRFEIQGVVHEALVSEDKVKLSMPSPSGLETSLGIVTEDNLEEGGFIVLGVPHLVIFANNVTDVDVVNLGKKYWAHPRFKNRTNVNFVQILDSNTIRVRTFERGVEDETLSCGTGSVSSAILSHLIKGTEPPFTVQTEGGVLHVNWDDFRQTIYLSGAAKIVYEGELIPPGSLS
ncbi:diaminopimelate epimerase [Acidobacteriota bacterium]